MRNPYYTKEEKQELRFTDRVATALIVVLLFCLLLFSGCTRKVYVPVQAMQRDSVVINRVDSINWIQKTNIRDSIRIKDSVVITKDQQGNITNKESYHEKDHYKQSSDSTSYYKDLLEKVLKEHEKQEPQIVEVEKPLTKWQRSLMNMGYCFMGTLLAGLLFLAGYSLKRKIK